MAIDASARARVLGVDTEFKDLRGDAIQFLPQRIALFAQGSTDVVYSLDKWQATSSAAGGTRYGFGSPIHLALRQLMPANGDGVGTIPVTVYPLENPSGGTAAAGSIAASGTATLAGAYRVRVSGVQSEQFIIPLGAVNANNVLRAAGDAINAVLSMPVKVTYTYGTVTASALVGTGNGTISVLSATTAKPGDYTLKVNTVVTNGGVWTLTDPDGTVISTALTQTVGVGGATVLTAGGLAFTITDGTTDFGLNATFTITVPATALVLTLKWKGASGNDAFIEILGDSLGVTFVLTQPTGGLVNPTVDSALAQVGGVWETLILNALNISDTTAIDAFGAFAMARWANTVRKPMVVFTGNTETTVASATAVCSARRTDYGNAQLVNPNTVELPFAVAARELARIAKRANDNPAYDYGSMRATGILPGPDGDQWTWAQRDQAIKLGSSTIEVKDGVVNLSDTITFYRPLGEEPPAYSHVVDIIKLMQIHYQIALRFEAEGWDGAPLIPDDQATVNPAAKRPKDAKAEMAAAIDGLALQAIISDPKSAKKSITAGINSGNPKRLDMTVTIKLSGNSNIKGVTLQFGFYFGTQSLAA